MTAMSMGRTASIVLGVTLAFMLCLTQSGCDGEKSPTGVRGFCWMGVDTLYASGFAVTDTTVVRAAFEAYIAFVDSTAAEFPGESDWTYLASRPYWVWRGRRYWQVDHEAYSPILDMRLSRRKTYVDENGMVVWPFHCI